MIALALPLPPSANTIWRNRKGSGKPHLSSEYQAWKQEAGWMIQAARLERVPGRFTMRVFVPIEMVGDIDNRLKPILDLAKTFVTDDDKFCDDLRISRSPEVPDGTCVVHVRNSTTASDADVVRQGAGFPLAPIPAAEAHGAASD